MTEPLPRGSRLVIFGYLGGRNFGDELMLLGLIAEAEAAGVGEIRIITPDGGIPPHLAGRLGGAFARSPTGMLAALRWSTTFAVCGGTVYHDAFDDRRYRNYCRSIASHTLLYLAARALGNRVLLSGVGVGPLRRWRTKTLLKLALRAAHDISVRDQASLDDIAGIGVARGKTTLRADLALSARPEFPPARPAMPPTILLSLVPAAITSLVPPARAQQFIDTLGERLADLLAANPRWRLTVLEVAVGQHDNDAPVARAMATAAAVGAPDRVDRLRFDGNPHHFLDAIGSASAVIASRYHIATAAELIGAPTFWIPYQRKVIDSAHDLGVSGERMQLPHVTGVPALIEWLCETVAP